jgi:hypothetical protein
VDSESNNWLGRRNTVYRYATCSSEGEAYRSSGCLDLREAVYEKLAPEGLGEAFPLVTKERAILIGGEDVESEPDLLRRYAGNVTSQCGEDGMIAELVRRLKLRDGWAVEFGAWDGKRLSNTYSLWHDQDWKALLIEGNKMKHEELRLRVSEFNRVEALLAWVSDTGPFALDTLLSEAGVPPDFELLSVDIDGDDYYMWAGMRLFKPKIVIIEYNASFPPHISYVQARGDHCGSSALSLCKLAEERGYGLVDLTPTNLIFVRNDLGLEPTFPQEPLSSLFLHEHLVLAWSDMRGRIHLETPAMWGFRPPVHLSRTMRRAGRQSIAGTARHALILGRRGLALDRRLYATGFRRLKTTLRRLL